MGINTKHEWEMARGVGVGVDRRGEPRPESCQKWHVPPSGRLKCNVDASFRPNDHKWGYGIVIRDHAGGIVEFRTGWKAGCPTVREGEAMALREALEWLEFGGYREMLIEVDSTTVAAAVQNTDVDLTEFGRIIGHCRSICNSHPLLQVRSVRRNRNRVADVLAHRSFSLASPSVGYASPIWLESALLDKCTDLNHR
ncbi:hypothetical protein LINPERHAP1_LOCUS24675 [Linum perenne]